MGITFGDSGQRILRGGHYGEGGSNRGRGGEHMGGERGWRCRARTELGVGGGG